MGSDDTSSLTGSTLICLGAVATTIGGLGVGFRAAGLGYLGQSLLALVLGLAMLTIGLKIAASARRSAFDAARRTPARVHTMYTTAAPQVARVRVPAWTGPQLELPAGRAA